MASRESSSPARSIVIAFYPTSQVVDAEALPRPDPDFLAVQAVCDAIERAAAERCWVKLEEIVTPRRRRVWPDDGRVSHAISAKLRDCVVRDAIVIEKKAKPRAVRNRYIALHID
jgi:hypothetical protein